MLRSSLARSFTPSGQPVAVLACLTMQNCSPPVAFFNTPRHNINPCQAFMLVGLFLMDISSLKQKIYLSPTMHLVSMKFQNGLAWLACMSIKSQCPRVARSSHLVFRIRLGLTFFFFFGMDHDHDTKVS